MNLNLPKSIRPFADRISRWDDERESDNPIFICYTKGWKSWTDPVGIQHSDAVMNIVEGLYHVRNAIPCTCTECASGRVA